MVLQILNAHSYPITALNFSDDGKMLATYAYGDSTISIWVVSGMCYCWRGDRKCCQPIKVSKAKLACCFLASP